MSTLATTAAALAAEFRAVGIYRTQDGGDDFPAVKMGGQHGSTYTGSVCVYANNSLRDLGLPRYPLENHLNRYATSQGFAGLIDWLNASTDDEVLAIMDEIAASA